MKESPMLSVALCTYNGERFLEEQLASIANQKLPVDEIIICDDGSKDNTLSIAQIFKEEHQSIHIEIYQNESNLGVLKNFEKAILKCHGDIIFCSDQDDIWMDNKTQEIVSGFDKKENVEMIFTDAILIDEYGNLANDFTLFDNLHINPKVRSQWKKGLEIEILNIKNIVTGATMAFRRDLINHAIPFNTNISNLHDEQFAICAAKRNSIFMLDKPLIKYRLHKNNVVGIREPIKSIDTEYHKYVCIPNRIRLVLEQVYPNSGEGNTRILFMKKRNRCFMTLKGRLILLFSIYTYIKIYKKNALTIYITDLTIGLDDFVKNKIKGVLNSLSFTF